MYKEINISPEYKKKFDVLIKLSEEDFYNPYDYFNWAEIIPEGVYWMSPELLSFYGTKYWDEFSEEEKIHISKYEICNFFSVTVNGEKNIKGDVLNYLETKYFKTESEYFNYFLSEESSHIYFFTKFCKTYIGKVYQYKKLQFNQIENFEIERLIVFTHTLIAEEIGDYFNKIMMKDERLPNIIKVINDRHHRDESRHLLMGRTIVKVLWDELKNKLTDSELKMIDSNLTNFINAFFADFYNPQIYKDSGIENSYELRSQLMAHNYRKNFQKKATSLIIGFLTKNKIIIPQN